VKYGRRNGGKIGSVMEFVGVKWRLTVGNLCKNRVVWNAQNVQQFVTEK